MKIIDVLSGAYMLIRKKVLDEVGLLDETFLCTEKILITVQNKKGGYENYWPKTKIIHYKGKY